MITGHALNDRKRKKVRRKITFSHSLPFFIFYFFFLIYILKSNNCYEEKKNDGKNTPLSCRCVLITISNSSSRTTTPPNRQKSIMKVLMQFSAFFSLLLHTHIERHGGVVSLTWLYCLLVGGSDVSINNYLFVYRFP
jgi:hypothetical protein